MPNRPDLKDPDTKKGANEESGKPLVSYGGQLPHRGTLPLVKDFDTDFPEPGFSPEHSGEEEIAGPARERKR